MSSFFCGTELRLGHAEAQSALHSYALGFMNSLECPCDSHAAMSTCHMAARGVQTFWGLSTLERLNSPISEAPLIFLVG